jgi:Ca-activated chloride channel family protein
VNVTVLDDKGMPLPRLGEDAFTITEDGIPQRIAHFASGEIPLSIVVAVDCSESMKGSRFDGARDAVKALLDDVGPDDEFTVIGFNDRPCSASRRRIAVTASFTSCR